MVVVVHLVFAVLALLVIYFVLVVPVYNYRSRATRARRDVTILFFSVIFTLVLLQILWSVHGDVARLVGG